MKFTRLLGGAALVLALAMAAPAHAKNSLRWASQGDALTLDPHAQNEGPTIAMSQQIYERLVERDPELNFIPGLATSWKVVSPTAWEFKLRQGVTFHDGTPFTAEDVVFSFERAKTQTSDFKNYINSVEEVKIVDPETVHVVTSEPNPILPNQVYGIFIMSKAWSEKHGVETPQNYKDKQETYAVRNANGTGPFKVQLREPDVRTVLVKNEGWWGLKELPHNVDEIVYTPIANQATRVAALLSGELDFLLDPPVQDLNRIKNSPGLQLKQVNQVRSIFLGLNVGADELRSSDVKGKNPLADRRVREAMYRAIDEDAIVQKVMRGLAIPAGIITSPGVHGYSKELDQRPEYDVEAAKKLLAEAGYPDGFSIKLDCPNDRYIKDEAICQAIVGMMGRIGIETALDAQSKSLHFPKIQKKESDFYMLGWGVPTLDSHYVFAYLYASKGTWNSTGYASERMDELTVAMNTAIDLEKRDMLIREAWELAKQDLVYLPLHHQVITWAMKDRLDMPIIPNDSPNFRYAKFK